MLAESYAKCSKCTEQQFQQTAQLACCVDFNHKWNMHLVDGMLTDAIETMRTEQNSDIQTSKQKNRLFELLDEHTERFPIEFNLSK